jgi:predicted NBD/HSP70 family sugar kinase
VGPAGRAVRQASLREHNLALVLREIVTADRPPSRADLAVTTGLTRATVGALVDDLIGGRLLTEVEPTPRVGAGRPALGLALADHGPAGLGLEINVDYLSACLVDLTGAVRHRAVQRLDLRPVSPAGALARIAGLAADARAAAARQGLLLAGTALAVPGLVDPHGVVRIAPNLGWHDVDVPALLPLPDGRLTVGNEANLAALGELRTGRGPTSFVYVSGEIGIGAGIILDGVLFRGARGFSGELGHIPVYPSGRPCRCGGRGCLEQYAGQEALLTAAGLTDRDQPADQAIERLLALAADDRSMAARALETAGTALGIALAGVINLLDVETVVLGGIYAPLAPALRPAIEMEIGRRVLTAGWSPATVRPARLGADAAVLGAAGSVIHSVLEHPAGWLADRDVWAASGQ